MLQSLIANISEIVMVIDQSGIICFSSPQLEKVTGLHTEDVVGRNIFDFIHPDDVSRARLEYAETIQKLGEEGVPSVLRIRDSDGSWIPFEIIANNHLDDRDIRGVIFTARDHRFRRDVENTIQVANADVEKRVEDRTIELAKANASLRLENQSRRKTENRLQETISLLNATLNSTADGLLVVRGGKVSGWNQRFCEMWHLPCVPAIGLQDTELLSAVLDQLQKPDQFVSKVKELYSNPSATSFDVLRFKDGRIYERYSQPQCLDNRIVGRVWSFRDVTEARRLEEDLRQSQKLEAVGRLAGGVAHDFNNLLMLISGYIGLLSETSLSSQQTEACRQALAATSRAAALTRQLLTFSRKHPDAPRLTNLNEIVSNLQGMLRSLVSENIRLDISLSDDPVPLLADVPQLEAVLMNLAINARDAMPDGGVLSLSTGMQERVSGAFGVLTVTDSGTGMTPEVRARIFEPFFTTKELGKGTGLGLSTAYGIVQRSGGYIEVESQPDHGTQFRVYIPRAKVPSDVTTASSIDCPPVHGHETILLAEDEFGIRAMARAYLEGLGYRVLEAPDGLEAVKISRQYNGPIDIFVTDLLMPIMRGDAAVRSIREHRPAIKVLYISGSPREIVSGEPAVVLLKPFKFSELGDAVRTLLGSNSDRRKSA